MSNKKIGIIGSGMVAQTLAAGFVKHGYDVAIGSRDLNKLDSWKTKSGVNAKTGSFEDAAKFGDILVLAVKGTGAEQAAKTISAFADGKTIIDTTNPIAEAAPENGVLKFFTDLNHSLMEKLQTALPKANFVKAFSSVGSTLMVDPKLKDGKPTMFICGDNENAKNEVIEILTRFGWDISDMGKVQAARAIEPLCILWCIPGFLQNDWTHAFKMLKP